MIHRTTIPTFFLLTLFLFPFMGKAQDGAKLFNQNCASCHTTDESKLVGPGLKGITEKRDMDWLIKWTKNSQQLIKSGDPQAEKIWKEYNKQTMPAQNLSDAEIKAIFDFVASGGKKASKDDGSGGGSKKAKAGPVETPMTIDQKLAVGTILLIAIGVLIYFIAVIDRAKRALKQFH